MKSLGYGKGNDARVVIELRSSAEEPYVTVGPKTKRAS